MSHTTAPQGRYYLFARITEVRDKFGDTGIISGIMPDSPEILTWPIPAGVVVDHAFVGEEAAIWFSADGWVTAVTAPEATRPPVRRVVGA